MEREASQNAKIWDIHLEADVLSLRGLIPVERMYNQPQIARGSLAPCTGWAQGIDEGRRVGGVEAAPPSAPEEGLQAPPGGSWADAAEGHRRKQRPPACA